MSPPPCWVRPPLSDFFADGSALRTSHLPRRRSITSCSMKRMRLGRLRLSDISFMRPKYWSMCGRAFSWSICCPMVVRSCEKTAE
eukprot:1548920-Prymnesium_polylepis.1